jgi:hypothetical protein
MSEDNIKTIKDEPHPCEVGTSCMICEGFIPLGFGYYGCYIPTTRICNECKKRLKKILYEDVAEGE